MSLFGSLKGESVTTGLKVEDFPGFRTLLADPSIATLTFPEVAGALTVNTDRGTTLSENDLEDQFLVFQFSDKSEGPRILETSQVTPKIKGTEEKPDIKARMQLTSFHIGGGEDIDKNSRATLRIDFGKDEKSNSSLDTVFWSIAAGLKLYDDIKKKPTDAKDLQSDFNSAFSKRPIEIPGGLSKLSFEVVKHQEPKWWQNIFTFLQSDTGKTLTSAIGFPGITTQAIGLVDELVNKLDNSKPKTLFKSRPMTLSLSEKAKSDFTGGLPGIELGSLNPGFCLLARGRDFKTIVDSDPVYMAAYGILKPKDVNVADFLQGNYDDPFKSVTYAVLRLVMAETELSFNLGL